MPTDAPAIAAPATTADPTAPVPATGGTAEPGFGQALARASDATPSTTRVSELPSIGLARMIATRAEAAAPAATPGGVPDVAPAEPTPNGPTQQVAGSRVEAQALGADPNGVLAAGERYLGVPYRWGGTDPATGLDCSGFVQRVYADLGVSLPRVSVDQAKAGTPVASLDQAQPGDLVFWYGSGSRPNHIGIYAGDDRMLVAPSSGDVVRYQDISRTPHEIRRVV